MMTMMMMVVVMSSCLSDTQTEEWNFDKLLHADAAHAAHDKGPHQYQDS